MSRFLKPFVFLALMKMTCVPVPALAAGECPKSQGSDVDGMPLCPDEVKADSAWAVYRCASDQAKSFHVPTVAEKGNLKELLSAWQTSITAGVKRETSAAILTHADNLELQVCRVKSGDDSYLLAFTAPGVKDYSGPFLMLREKSPSKIVLISPHDDSDGTAFDTKYALSNSHALAVVSNGHKRFEKHGVDDFVHSTNNLAYDATMMLGNMFEGLVVLHVHGMSNDVAVLHRERGNEKLGAAFEKAVRAHTKIEKFGNLNADFSIDAVGAEHGSKYLKTEMPAQIHLNNRQALAEIVRDLEKESWAQ